MCGKTLFGHIVGTLLRLHDHPYAKDPVIITTTVPVIEFSTALPDGTILSLVKHRLSPEDFQDIIRMLETPSASAEIKDFLIIFPDYWS